VSHHTDNLDRVAVALDELRAAFPRHRIEQGRKRILRDVNRREGGRPDLVSEPTDERAAVILVTIGTRTMYLHPMYGGLWSRDFEASLHPSAIDAVRDYIATERAKIAARLADLDGAA
jgi:hypothetical protein